jgi:hypothetical protein
VVERLNENHKRAEQVIVQEGNSMALVLVRDAAKEVDAFMGDMYPRLQTRSVSMRYNRDGNNQGSQAGARADIHGGRNNLAARKSLSS